MKKIINLFLITTIISLAIFSCASDNVEKVEKPSSTPQAVSKKSEAQLEYERATKDLVGEVVSMDTYELDKKIILAKIAELNEVMKSKNYKAWIGYIDRNSVDYWSQKKNLSAVSKQLPVKGLNLRTLEDYFNYVFIPSRMGRRIDEIRYISSTSIKAVQVKNADDVIIFYNFKKVNGEWLVELPAL